MSARRRPTAVFPITAGEFVLSSTGTALAIYVIGAVMGVQWFG